MIRNVPHLALIPLVILWFGIDETAKIFLVALGVFFPIYVNTQLRHFNRKVAPNLGTVLEDFYQRGDRQRLFWAKVEVSL